VKNHSLILLVLRVTFAFLGAAGLIVQPCLAADFTGSVISVLDGDTIEVLHNHHPERIRLNGIDCPEKGQAYGNNAKQAASALVYGKEGTLETHGLDKYGRTIADVLLLDGTNLNYTFIKTAGGGIGKREIVQRVTIVSVSRSI
jgi:endonuclease YncB( thermonuclease family)